MYPDLYSEGGSRRIYSVDRGTFHALDVFGPTLEFCFFWSQESFSYCLDETIVRMPGYASMQSRWGERAEGPVTRVHT